MAYDVSKAALPALWKADPGFQELAKFLYGSAVTLEDVQKDLFGKMDPGQSDVHAQQPAKVGRKKKPLVVDERVLQSVGKSFVDIVEKAYSEGLIDDEGNLDMEEIEKSRSYVRDHTGRFASAGSHTGQHVASLIGAGALAAGGATLAAKSPNSVKYAGESIKFVSHHLKSADPVERHVARALLPHALAASGKAVAQAGGGAVASAGAVYEGTRAYTNLRNEATRTRPYADRQRHLDSLPNHPERYETKAARLQVPLRLGAEVVNRGARAADAVEVHVPKHKMGKAPVRRLRNKVADKVRDAAYNPTVPLQSVVDLTKRDYHRDQSGKFAAGGVAGLAVAGAASEGAGRAVEAQRKVQAAAEEDPKRMWQELAHGSREYANSSGSRTAASQATSFEMEAANHAGSQAEYLRRGRAAAKLGRKGAIGAGIGAAALGYGALVHHENQKRRETFAHRAPDVTWEGEFSKVDEDKRQVFGWASVAELDGKPVVDLQGDYIHPDDVEKAAYDYVLKARVGGDMHARIDEYGNIIEKADKPYHVSDLIESMVFTPEKCEAMGISKSIAGRWWTGFQINDPDVWQAVKDGERTGFSIHGAGMRKSIDIDELDPESELIGKAYQESETVDDLVANLETLTDVTGSETFSDLAKHLHHGLHVPQIDPQQSRNAGVYGSGGSGAGGLAGGIIGAKFGHPGEGAGIGAAVGGLTGTAVGVHSGRPKRPALVEAAISPPHQEPMIKGFAGGVERVARVVEPAVMRTGRTLDRMGIGNKVRSAAQNQADRAVETTGVRRRVRRTAAVGLNAAGHTHPVVGLSAAAATAAGGAAAVHHAKRAPEAEDYFVDKSVATTNRMGGAPASRQNMYQQHALQQATEMLAPQVASHIQQMQEQQWQQQMMEQQMLQQQAGQQGQDFAVQMGPYANHQQSQGGQNHNPLAPPQQATPSAPSAPTGPTQHFPGS